MKKSFLVPFRIDFLIVAVPYWFIINGLISNAVLNSYFNIVGIPLPPKCEVLSS